MKKVIIIGMGPAGLTAAYELLNQSKNYEVIIIEESDCIGGISRTVNYKGNRMDIGGHRFFSKIPQINEWWENILPLQGAPSKDDKILKRKANITQGGPNPEKTDKVMLKRNRLSRIFFNDKFYDYPIQLNFDILKKMGLGTTILVGLSYIKSVIFKRKEKSLEDFYINHFGKKLYQMFFENYTENVWGGHPKDIAPDWGSQRVKGLSIKTIILNQLNKILKKKNRKIETSLIEEFFYPKLGPGQLWERVAKEIENKGGKLIKNAKVTEIHKNNKNKITGITYIFQNEKKELLGDYVISSMPLKDLIIGLNNVPPKIVEIARGLPYRDYITIGVLLKHLKLKNETKIKTIGNIIPDNWIYVHNKNIKMCRFQIYNNWSPYLVKKIENTVWIGLEYFCDENDIFWKKENQEIVDFGIKEMIDLHLIDKKTDVLDFHVERVKKAYPAYFDTYSRIEELRSYLDTIPNLFCVGRNGQHRYNNMDHSMQTAFETVKNIINEKKSKENIWNVNTEQGYHEEKK